jgi:hypothetical protein
MESAALRQNIDRFFVKIARRMKMKPSEFLNDLDSHGIYDDAILRQDYENLVGRPAPWRSHDSEAIRDSIKARGLGGSYESTRNGVTGYEIAESIADELCANRQKIMIGRGSRFREAVDALKLAGF